MLTSLGLCGDLDDVELIHDVEQAFAIRLPGDELKQCNTVGELYDTVIRHLSASQAAGNRCASAMCFYSMRRATLTVAPKLQLRPSTPINVLHNLSIRSLYRAFRDLEQLRPPNVYVSKRGVCSLFLAVAAPVSLMFLGAPWWTAPLALLIAVVLYRVSPVRLPPQVESFGNLVELVTAKNIGFLAANGGRLRSAEAWTALKAVCVDHVATKNGKIGRGTLIYAPNKTAP